MTDDLDKIRNRPSRYADMMPAAPLVSPSLVPPSGGTTITISGTKLGEVKALRIGGITCAFTIIDDETLSAVTPALGAGANYPIEFDVFNGTCQVTGGLNVASNTFALSFPSAGDMYRDSPGSWPFTETPGTIRFRFRIESVPVTTLLWLAGFNASSSGWLISTENVVGAMSIGQLVAYIGADGQLKRIGKKVLLASMVGQIATIHLLFDGSRARWFYDGWEIGDGQVNSGFGAAYTSYDPPTGTDLGIGSRASDGHFTTAQSVVELAMTGTILTPAQILTDAHQPVGSPMPGAQQHHYTVTQGLGATWADALGGPNLLKVGTPSVAQETPSLLMVKRTFNGWGDSILAGRQADTSLGDGWRRRVQIDCCTAGKGITWVGGFPPTGSANPDYDFWNDGHPAESLSTRLATFATDLANDGSATTGVVLAYGINDIAVLNHSAAQLQADIASACGVIYSIRPGVPIVIVNIYDVATSAATGPQHVQIQAYIAGFASMIASLQNTGFDVAGADVSGVITDPNDTAQLYDGVHPTPTYYNSMGLVIAPAVMSLL